MSSNVQNFLLKAALAGLVAGSVACGGSSTEHAAPGEDHADGQHKEKHDPATAVNAVPAVPAVPAEQPAAGAEHACKGQNACKGQGGCKVEGVHDCAGKNACKGQGGCASAMAPKPAPAEEPPAGH